jgi:parvulin-like peptidyl-prolyl isomerase
MKPTVLLLCIVCFIGCSSLKQSSDSSVPHVLIQSQLPPIPVKLQQPVIELDVVMFIMEDGTVGKTRMLKGSGDAEWDSLALSSIKEWRFTPARMENKPVGSWFHMQSTLRYADPQYMNLAEILCTSEEEADSLYKVIEQGQNFKELAMRYSVDPSREMGGILGNVNINVFPDNIRRPLSILIINDYTKPIKYGDLYAIFKRLEK